MNTYAYKTLLAATLLIGGFCQEYLKDDFIGLWENENKSLRMEIYYGNECYHGRLTSIAGSDPGHFRERADKVILVQMKRSNNVLYGGTYRDYMTLDENEARVRLINDTVLKMKIYNGWFGKHYKWCKVK